jgi:hypothetical protein
MLLTSSALFFICSRHHETGIAPHTLIARRRCTPRRPIILA